MKFIMRTGCANVLINLLIVFGISIGAAWGAPTSEKAWEDYNAGRFSDAYDGFSALHSTDVKNPEYALGLAYSALKTGKLDLALELALAFEKEKPDFSKIKISVYSAKANAAYEAKEYKGSAGYFKHVVEAGAADDGVRTLLAWSLFHLNELDQSLEIFLALYAKSGDKSLEDTIVTIYKRKGSARATAEFAMNLPKDATQTRKLLAEYVQKARCPALAAEIFNASDVCWYNAHTPDVAFGTSIRSKTGSQGSSYLIDVNSPVKVTYPISYGNTVSLTAVNDFLYTGKAPLPIFAGSAYKGIFLGTPVKNNLPTSLSVWSIEAGLRREGDTLYSLDIGIAPIGGPVSPAPLFRAGVERATWKLGAHQEPVAESILSFTGLKDPYGDDAWGRVVKAGVEGQYTFSFNDYWLSLKAGYDKYTGQNVIKNEAVTGTVAFGKSEMIKSLGGDYEVNAGIFSSYSGFKRNLAFYTFGHGGYFSPQKFYVIGPIVSFQTKHCEKQWTAGNITVNYRYFRNDDAYQFPYLPPQALIYRGSTTRGIGYAGAIEEHRLLGPHWAASVAVKYDRSADYIEWKAAANLTYSFEPRGAVKLD